MLLLQVIIGSTIGTFIGYKIAVWSVRWENKRRRNRYGGGCKDCLFFVNPYYPVMECIENDRFIYKLKEEKTECKRFVKATKENANEWLKSHKERRIKNEDTDWKI